ncbi:Cyclin [Macleaya cordata]|uniref:Cyclin n=1 Tax=Macleaya cordata TaxID=56857 RepID=A0A200Q0I1_MACCD|nr:Cyclin [Macleaya cordata]
MSLSPEHSASNLYCGEDAGDVAFWDDDTWIPDLPTPLDFTIDVDDDDQDDRTITWLIDSELDHIPVSDYLRRIRDHSIDPISRQDAINWMLKVHAHYHFRPVTAYLSVNYLDRFLSYTTLPPGNGWPLQLLSVACLSLAAKMEEIKVPLLLDLQILEPRFVFEPRTVRRMELLVMSNLKWRLRSVTPFDFVDYFVSKLHCFGSSRNNVIFSRIFSRASDLILNTIRVIDFLGYSPSTIAAAAVLLASGECVDFPAVEDQNTVNFYDRVSKEVVRGCHRLMGEYLTDTCPLAGVKHVISPSAPPQSPIGVLDAASCKSCDTQKSSFVNTESSQAEPSNKRQRLGTSDVQ